MKERPILMSAEMVRAILAGTKSQTRRVVKPQAAVLTDACARAFGVRPPERENTAVVPCPFGMVGDRLWVRETWKPHFDASDLYTCIKYRADGAMIKPRNWSPSEGWWCEQRENEERWYPSIFMKRSYCRLVLEITSVRVERLREISEADAKAEGVKPSSRNHTAAAVADIFGAREFLAHTSAFATLWEKLNGLGSWEINPWVWVIEFRRVQA